MIIVGAGLSGLLTAWRCFDANPEIEILVIEASGRIAGDHTWSFNLTDIPEHLNDWISPFIAYQWSCYDVKFPKRERTLEIPYCTGNSDTLRACVQPHINSGRLKVLLNTKVTKIDSTSVMTETGRRYGAKCVLDARGFKPNDNVFLGYQKFVGHVIKTVEPHGIERPIIMDATVKQFGGYRFVYCLPFTDTEMLVEDTYYTDGPELRRQEIDARIKDYIRDNLGMYDYEVIQREKGVLPITLAVDENAFDNDRDWSKREIGIRGGFYHAISGYSLPDALIIADIISEEISEGFEDYPENPFKNIDTIFPAVQIGHFENERFLRLLNRMLFRAAKPEGRYKILQRFYGLSDGLIKRFYANELKRRDKVRILIGKPPVPVSKALYNFSEKAFIKRERAARTQNQ